MASVVLVDQEGNVIQPEDIRYDADDSAPIYIGLAGKNKTPTNNPAWTVYKFTYNGTAVTRIQKVSNISWDNRATSSYWV